MSFTLPKKDGSNRTIEAPQGVLKTVQRRLATYLLALYGSRSTVHGFSSGKSIITNARVHVGRAFVFNIDLSDFFNSIHFGRVYGLFAKSPYRFSPSVARVLTQLCCFKGRLPQGAPTSPIVSNLVCAQLDTQLKLLARKHKCRYTRYADDITFSSAETTFPTELAMNTGDKWQPSETVEAIIKKSVFSINPTKTRMQRRSNRQSVTGLVVNRKVNIERRYLQSVRGMLRAFERDGVAEADKRWREEYRVRQTLVKKDFLSTLVGRVAYIGQVKGWDSHAYLRLCQRLAAHNIKVRATPGLITKQASRLAMDCGNWLVEAGLSADCAAEQSSGFSWSQHGIVTACHAVGEYDSKTHEWVPYAYVQVSQPHLGNGKVFACNILALHPHADLALLAYPFGVLTAFEAASAKEVQVRDVVRVLGFPHYHLGDSCADQAFVVTQRRTYSGITHNIVGGAIIKGNSGGPAVNYDNQVIGIALKGQAIPAHFSDQDSLSSFAIAKTLKLLLLPEHACKSSSDS